MHRTLNRLNKYLILVVVQLLIAAYFPLNAGADGRFKDNGDGTVTDSRTGLIWAKADNGHDIEFDDAVMYCREISLGGHNDWRLPDIAELKTIYEADAKNTAGLGISSPIKVSSCCLWSSYDSTGVSSLIDLRTGKEIWSFKSDKEGLRVLPVRGKELD